MAPDIVVKQELQARGIDPDLLLVSPTLADLIATLIEERDVKQCGWGFVGPAEVRD